MQWLLTSICCTPFGHISKTEQDRLILIRNIIRKLASLILLPHSDPPSDTPQGRHSGFKYKLCASINTAVMFDFGVRPFCCILSIPSSHSRFTVINRVQHLELVVHNHRPLCCTSCGPTSVSSTDL